MTKREPTIMSEPLTHSALAALVSGILRSGDPDALVHGLNSLSEAQPGEVSFLGNSRYLPQLATTEATAVLVTADHSSPIEGKALIEVANPTLAFSAVITHFGVKPQTVEPGIHPTAHVAASAQVHPTAHIGPLAIVEADAIIGPHCRIYGGAYIGHAVRLGEHCVIHAQVAIREHCILGNRVIIHSCSAIGTDGFGYEFSGGRHVKVDQVGIVQIDDDVEIGSCTSIDRARFGKTHIGAGTKIDNQVQIAHNVVIGKHSILVSQVGISGSSRLGDYVIIGGQAGVAGHLKIASRVTLLGRSGATKDIPAPGYYTGFPAKPVMEGRRLMVYPTLVPELKAQLKALEKRITELEQQQQQS
jgi:UDP-3-O-[3-hydroxymyristoyl] glucosamine N-acyltransferase